MRHILFPIAFMALSLTSLAAVPVEPVDTVTIVETVVDSITVDGDYTAVPVDNEVEIIDNGDDEAPTIHLLGHGNKSARRGLGGNPHFNFEYGKLLYGGMIWPQSAPESRLSYEVGIAQVAALQYRPSGRYAPRFSIGLGFGYRKLSLDEGYRFDLSAGRLSTGAMPEGSRDSWSCVEEWDLQLPVLINQRLYKRLSIMAGVIPTFNVYSTASTVYWLDDSRYTERYKGLSQNVFRVELIGGIGLRDIIGVYVRYCPTPLYQKGFGPRWKTLSLGLTLNF